MGNGTTKPPGEVASQGEAIAAQASPHAAAHAALRSSAPSNPIAKIRVATVGRRLQDVCEFQKGTKALGQGSFGTVWLARMKANSKVVVAVKTMDKAKLKRQKVPASVIQSEVLMMKEAVGNESCVQIYDFIETKTEYYLIIEYCADGDLQASSQKVGDVLGEQQVARIMSQVFASIAFLHNKSICHRDIKPHNFMLTGSIDSETVQVKLGDFGIAVRIPKGRLLTEQVGTPAFMAPEMHLLPHKSTGYDNKVDVWAAGVCMVFLLAHEYPFMDGRGQLLRQELVQGNLPLWDVNVFSDLFSKFGEATGIDVGGNRRRLPSKSARGLVRELLTPVRKNRPTAAAASAHEWFSNPVPEETDDSTWDLAGVWDDAPLLNWVDFQDGFSLLQGEIAGMADHFEAALSSVHVTSFEPPSRIDPSDERVNSCVVCYGSSGHLGYICPQCSHAVCMECLERLPRKECPHCRHETQDIAVTQTMARFARVAAGGAVQLTDDLATTAAALGDLSTALPAPLEPVTQEDRKRMGSCHVCDAPARLTNHNCPACSASFCYACAKNSFATLPECPCCGETERNREALQSYFAAAEILSTTMEFGASLGEQASALTVHGGVLATSALDTLVQGVEDTAGGIRRNSNFALEALATSAGATASAMHRESSSALDTMAFGAGAIADSVHRESSSALDTMAFGAGAIADNLDQSLAGLGAPAVQLPNADQTRLKACFLCAVESSSLDHVCPLCNTAVCNTCICSRLSHDLRCPHCKDVQHNQQDMHFRRQASETWESAQVLWGGMLSLGRELFVEEQPQPPSSNNIANATPPEFTATQLPRAEDPTLPAVKPSRPLGDQPVVEEID